MNNYYGYQPNLDRINRQIEELTNLRTQIQQQPQQSPITNYINTTPQKVDLEAKILTDGQSVRDTLVQNRTVFIDEKNKKISIKEVDGTISKEYDIVVPKTPQELEIEELKNTNSLLQTKINNMEVLMNEYAKSNGDSKSTQNVFESNAINIANDTTKSKKSSK